MEKSARRQHAATGSLTITCVQTEFMSSHLARVAGSAALIAALLALRTRQQRRGGSAGSAAPRAAGVSIAVVVASQSIFDEITDTLQLTPWAGASVGDLGRCGVQVRAGRVEGTQVHCLFTGVDQVHGCDRIGPEPAILATTLLLTALKADLVVHVGLCGGFRGGGFVLGDVVAAWPSVFFFDRRMSVFGAESKASGVLETSVWSELPAIVAELNSAGAAGPGGPGGVCTGKLGTGSSFDCDEENEEWLHDIGGDGKGGKALKDMEACGVGWVASTLGLPFVSLVGVSNYIVGPVAARELAVTASAVTRRLT